MLPLALAAAHLRAPRHLRKRPRDLENNYVAENSVSNGKKKRNRNRPGAPAGNLNAFKHGAYCAEAMAFRAHVHDLVSSARLTLKLRKLALKERGT